MLFSDEKLERKKEHGQKVLLRIWREWFQCFFNGDFESSDEGRFQRPKMKSQRNYWIKTRIKRNRNMQKY